LGLSCSLASPDAARAAVGHRLRRDPTPSSNPDDCISDQVTLRAEGYRVPWRALLRGARGVGAGSRRLRCKCLPPACRARCLTLGELLSDIAKR